MDRAPLLALLPIEQRLALAYSPRSCRDDLLALLALDARLAGVVRSGREVMLAQLRLAWWRDRLSAEPSSWPEGEPLMLLLRRSRLPVAAAARLVDGWEQLLGAERLGPMALAALVDARVEGFAALAAALGLNDGRIACSARAWAIADLSARLSDPGERALLAELPPSHCRLPREMRTLAVLAGLAQRRSAKPGAPLMAGPGALLAALRIGLTGH